MRAFKYLSVFIFPIVTAISFCSYGWITFIPVFFAFGFIPIFEQIFKRSTENLKAVEREIIKKDRIYDFLLYVISFVHLAFAIWFLFIISESESGNLTISGRVLSMGILIGVTCINVAHELGHRKSSFDKLLSQILLFSTQYTHFYIEHNQGHHKNVSTPDDPASARKGEILYFFWIRSIIFSYISAWKIQLKNLKRKSFSFLSLKNKMLVYFMLQVTSLFLIYQFFSFEVLLYYLLVSFIGVAFLETINYIEHYGLSRKKVNEFRYEDTQPQHSWNSNHILGRIMLFELTRHSDHHYEPSKKYQILDSHDKAPTLPMGYPASMLLSMLPPLWFIIMNKKVNEFKISEKISQ